MKLTLLLSLIASVAAGAQQKYSSMKASSVAAQNLLASSRSLEDNFDEIFIASHSLIFQSCHHSSSWTEDGYQQNDMVRFILCPSDSCSSNGCSSSSYGEYVVDLMTFVDAYMEYQMEALAYKCESLREQCGCEDENSAYCLYYCFKDTDDNSWAECGKVDDGDEDRMGECARFEIENDDDKNRRLGSDDGDDEYFIGPYCSDDGTGVFMTLFADEACSVQISGAASIYKTAAGVDMPYQYESGSSGLIEPGCVSCMEPKEQNDDDGEDEDQVIRMCEETYEEAAKCETNMLDMYYCYRDSSGCNFIDALKGGNGSTAYSSTWMGANSAAYFGVFVASIVLAVGAATLLIRKRRQVSSVKSTPLVEAELSPQQYSEMS